jgi:hypothetical protein
MKREPRRKYLLAFWIALAGCGGPSASVSVPDHFPPEKVAEVALATYDANSDGKIAGAELEKSPSLQSALPRLDTSNDKAISADEIMQRMQVYEKQSTLIATTVQVLSNAQPLAGATVRLEPEPFMGEDLESYVVLTGESGSGVPEIAETGELKTGLPLGFYRVTITHPNHSDAVVRGCEMADDAPMANRLVFSMQDASPQSAGGRYSGR